MTTVPLSSPYSMKAAAFSVAADDYTAAISQAQLDPSTQTTTWRGIGGNVLRDQTSPEWMLTLGLAQDLAPTGLLRYLLDHTGEEKAVTLTPVATGPDVTATVIIAPGSIGGSADGNRATATVQLAVIGAPAFVD